MYDDNGDDDNEYEAANLPAIAVEAATITVNGRLHRWAGATIDADDLAELAFPDAGEGGSSSLTIAYGGGVLQSSGLMPAGGSVRVVEGQRFSVSLTDKS